VSGRSCKSRAGPLLDLNGKPAQRLQKRIAIGWKQPPLPFGLRQDARNLEGQQCRCGEDAGTVGGLLILKAPAQRERGIQHKRGRSIFMALMHQLAKTPTAIKRQLMLFRERLHVGDRLTTAFAFFFLFDDLLCCLAGPLRLVVA
jgi:hypothetical protein